MRHLALCAALSLVMGGRVSGAVVVNEVLSNEPASESSLEWLELYNPAATAAFFSNYELRVYSGAGSAAVPLTGSIAGGQYLVLCRDTVRFEEHFGDSSGVWGDAAREQGFQLREAAFQLANTGGRVTLTEIVTSNVSEIAWTVAGVDGYSWERYYHTMGEVGQSVDPSGSTPGRINSITPMPVDIALEGVEVLAEDGNATIAFRIVNRGLNDISNAILELYEFDSGESDSLGDLVAGESVGAIDSGLAVLLIGQYRFQRYYQRLVGQLLLASDSRPFNNRFAFTAPGEDYPPVVLSEFLPEPELEADGEWVELKNISDTTIDLAGWSLGDSAALAMIAATELPIHPGEYLVLAQDTAGFDRVYPLFAGRRYQPPDWRTLNNGSDSVRLADLFGIQADRFYYDRTYEGNHTWARSESPEHAGVWGRSEEAGGSPGAANTVRLMPEGSRTLRIGIEPRIISPDGDGIDDSALISIEASEADGYTLKVYDAQGRPVRTLDDDAPGLREHYVWRGEGDDGKKLPIGIYILYVEAVGIESAKKTIVVAR